MTLTPTDFIALYAAVVATFVAVDQLRNSRARVVVTVQRIWISDSAGRFSDEEICVQAVNVGTRAVNFGTLPSLWYGKIGILVPSPHPASDVFPCRLQPGASCKVFMRPVPIAESFKESGAQGTVRLRGKYVDETRRVYWSRSFSFDVDTPLLPKNKGQRAHVP